MNRAIRILRAVRQRALRSILGQLERHEQRISELEEIVRPLSKP